MKVLFLGDTHGSWTHLHSFTERRGDWDVVVQVGDFGYWPRTRVPPKRPSRPVLFIPGNHEDWSLLPAEQTEVWPNIVYLPRNTEFQLGGRSIFCMGGGESVDKAIRKAGWDWFPQESITDQDLDVMPRGTAEIVLSHDCPRRFDLENPSKSKPWQQTSRLQLDRVWEEKRPALWFFGHHHWRESGVYEQTRWYLCSEAGVGEAYVLDMKTLGVRLVTS